VITVHGDKADYAIMKQVQQLKLAYPAMQIVTLDASTDFSALSAGETLYLVSHGDIETGNLRDIDRKILLDWLTAPGSGVRHDFGGIVILSCYSGLEIDEQDPKGPEDLSKYALAKYLAIGLTGKVDAGRPVAGANGYSFGTPEFQASGRSSVLPLELAAFYAPDYIDAMVQGWLKRTPTHTGGVLKDESNINVDTGKTIGEHLDDKTSEATAKKYVTAFAKVAKEIEGQLVDIITHKIPGDTVADRTAYLVNNGAQVDVKDWNDAIAKQYKLFHDFYLWAPSDAAFTIETTK
jgi:hypothetical protein